VGAVAYYRSASIYEYSTEALFFGRQDAMQRTSLVPVADFIRNHGLDPSGMTLLEVSCGTGRFHTFIKVSWPCCHPPGSHPCLLVG